MKLIEFGESITHNDRGYILTDKGKQTITEYKLHCLWCNWVSRKRSITRTEGNTMIYALSRPVKYEQFLATGKRLRKRNPLPICKVNHTEETG